jgi:hypothetical protein
MLCLYGLGLVDMVVCASPFFQMGVEDSGVHQ